ncbi:MAG: CinA family protein [Oscillospiraceae bacterium]|nr:CinA family protein [Oscillospiraceae bacterium]
MGNTAEFELIKLLLKKEATVATAESCTGGMVAARLTSVSGASGAFKYGAVIYCNEAKNAVLGVSTETLDEHGAISAETAKEMAEGIRKVMSADIGVSVTGNAGPGAAENKEVGLVYIGVSSDNYSAVLENHFEGDRISVRAQAADAALSLALSAAEKLAKE